LLASGRKFHSPLGDRSSHSENNGLVGSSPVSCLGDAGFEYRPEGCLFWLIFLWFYSFQHFNTATLDYGFRYSFILGSVTTSLNLGRNKAVP
jgi:hypothetical protein